MPINRFKSLQGVLSQTRDVICGVYGLSSDDAFRKTEGFIRDNSEQWRLPEPDINYNDPFCRMSYLYMNVAVHATLVQRAMGAYPEIYELIAQKNATGEELRVCALGGGPGSELLGLVRFIEELKDRSGITYVDFALVDRVREWDESWHALKAGVDEQLAQEYGRDRNAWPVSISRSFLPLDTTRPEEFTDFATRFSGTDIFIVCYLVSELKGHTGEFESVLNLLVQRANSGALVLFIDRDEKEIRETVESIIELDHSLTSLGTKKERGALEDDLQDLGEWFINIETLPRQRWLAFCTLARKTEST